MLLSENSGIAAVILYCNQNLARNKSVALKQIYLQVLG